jgi:glyoxylate/hydroxypyruvate reductase A
MPPLSVRPALIFISEYNREVWARELARALPEFDVRFWPEIGRPEDVEIALVWKHPEGALRQFPRLRLIVNLGAGVDYILADSLLPKNVPVVRLVDPGLTRRMTEYVALHTLALHRRCAEMIEAQRVRQWHYLHPVVPSQCCVGIMGIGNLGTEALAVLAGFGFRLAGWSRTAKSLPGVACFHGARGLPGFLGRCDILICLLPLTPATENLIDSRVLGLLPKGAAFINAGRGPIVVDGDLIAALDSGHIRHATLDVFRIEPLPDDHPFWRNPNITITPHNSSATDPISAASQVAENVRRVMNGEAPLNRVDPAVGY